MITITVTHDVKEIMSQLYDPANPKKGYELAAEKQMNLSAFIETISPTKPGDVLDGFGRCLQHYGIVINGDPNKGIYPSKGNAFFQSNMPESRVLFPEFINRSIHSYQMEQTNYLSYLVSAWDIQDTNVFRSFYFDDTAAQRQAGRRGEGAVVKKFKVAWSEKAVSVVDFSIELDMSYEFVRWAALPVIQLALQRVALQRQLDEAGEALYVLQSGDGSGKEATGAAKVTLSSLGVLAPGGTESMTYGAYLKFLAGFDPYRVTTIVGTQDDVIDLMLMAKPSSDPALLYTLLDKSRTGGVPEFVNLPFGNLAVLQYNDASILAANKLLALDKRFALMGHRALGMDLVETDRIISGKWEKIVIGNYVGFSNIFAGAAKYLDTDE